MHSLISVRPRTSVMSADHALTLATRIHDWFAMNVFDATRFRYDSAMPAVSDSAESQQVLDERDRDLIVHVILSGDIDPDFNMERCGRKLLEHIKSLLPVRQIFQGRNELELHCDGANPTSLVHSF